MVDINDLQDIAWLMGGQCLSRTYAPGILMNWACGNGHKWRMIPEMILGDKWCPHCSGEATSSCFAPIKKPRKYTLDYVIRWASRYNVKCLSKVYHSAIVNMDWQCDNGHKWTTPFGSLKSKLANLNSRYPDESQHIICTECLRDSRRCQFEGCNKRALGRKREYCREHLDKSYVDRESCKFIYFHHHDMKDDPEALTTEFLQDMFDVKCNRLEKEDMEEIEKDAEDVKKTLEFLDKEKDKDKDYGWKRHKHILNIHDLKMFAEYVNAEVLDTDYEPHQTKPITWRCKKEGHTWSKELRPSKERVFRHGNIFCPQCQGSSSHKTLNDLQNMAESVDCECLSTEFDLSERIEWRCKWGHIWENMYKTARRRLGDGIFCPMCERDLGKHPVFDLADVKQFADWRDIECLSTKYVDGNEIRWRCNKGHEFNMTIRKLNYRGKYNACPKCTGRRGTKDRFKKANSTKQ